MDKVKALELKSCPFCGGDAELITDAPECFVRCTNDHCRPGRNLPETAVSDWNTRASNTGETQGGDEIRTFTGHAHTLREDIEWIQGRIFDLEAKRISIGHPVHVMAALHNLSRAVDYCESKGVISFAEGVQPPNTPGTPIEEAQPCPVSSTYETGWDDAMQWCQSQGLIKDGVLIPRYSLTPSQGNSRALEIFDRFCKFIDGLYMNATFHENDFMSKSEQKLIRTALQSTGGNKGDAWQDIRTAPKDGTEILGYNSETNHIWLAHYEEADKDWYAELGDCPLDPLTHWMPLPKPPRDTKKD